MLSTLSMKKYILLYLLKILSTLSIKVYSFYSIKIYFLLYLLKYTFYSIYQNMLSTLSIKLCFLLYLRTARVSNTLAIQPLTASIMFPGDF